MSFKIAVILIHQSHDFLSYAVMYLCYNKEYIMKQTWAVLLAYIQHTGIESSKKLGGGLNI